MSLDCSKNGAASRPWLAGDRDATKAVEDEIAPRLLSDLLWAAYGLGGPDDAYEAGPVAGRHQGIEVYVALKGALYRFDLERPWLQWVLGEDVRAEGASLNLMLVIGASGVVGTGEQERDAVARARIMSRNLRHFCASEDLAVNAYERVDFAALTRRLGLGAGQAIAFACAVSWPASKGAR